MLKISRDDIHGRELIEYGASRGIKLPIKPYMELIPARNPIDGSASNVWLEANAAQIALINAVNSPKYRFICAALSRRLGKTYIANIIGQLVALVPGCNILIMSPNYSLSTISFELQRKLISTFDLEIIRDNVKDKVIELSNGSTIRMGSVNQVDSCVGRSYDLIIFDEAALSKSGEEAFNVSLRPTLDRPGSKAIFISTPRGKKNWFSKFFNRGYSSEPELSAWISIHADYTENKRMTEDDVKEARGTMSASEFEQEYMASFNTFSGQIYSISQEHILDELPPGNYEFFGGLDPGYKDATAFIVIAYNLEEEYYVVVDEYLESEKVTSQHADAIQELITANSVDAIFIDPAAAQFAADLAYQYDIATIKAKKAILEGIAFVQSLVQNGKLKVLRHCTNTLDMLDQYQWDTSDNVSTERPLHNEFSHMADALRYGLYSWIA